jgi:hypothetical protein
VGAAIAPKILKVNGVFHAPQACPVYGVACLVGSFVHSKSLPAELEHFGHEWQPFKRAVLIKRRQDFLLAPNLNHVATLGDLATARNPRPAARD